LNILSVADHIDPLVYSLNIKSRYGNIDCVLGAGDLELSYYEYIISCLNKPLYFVFGNHNLTNLKFFCSSPDSLSVIVPGGTRTSDFGSICVDGKVVRDRKLNLIIAGLGGCHRYNNGKHQFTEWQMFLRIIKFLPRMMFFRLFQGRWVDILLTHASPAGIHDRDDPCHKGFKTFLLFMRLFKPRYLIHGHVHLYDINAPKDARYWNTIVLNSYNHIVIDWESGMKENSYVVSQADNDFSRARQKAWIESVKSIINPEAGQLLSFNHIKTLLKPGKEKYLGMQTVSIANIVGSEDRYQDFSKHFFPKREHLKSRWTSVDRAFLTDIILPPIKLLKIGDMHFVRDGNHRVSVALSQGAMAIDAEVIELTAEIPIEKNATTEAITKAVLTYERNTVLSQTDLGSIIPVEMIEFTTPGRWHEVLNHIEGHKYFINMNQEMEMPFEEAVRSWYNNLYLPVVEIIRNENLLSHFPRRTEADLLLWIVKHWHCLKEKFGQDYPLDQAASEYVATHGKGKGLLSRLIRSLKALFRNTR